MDLNDWGTALADMLGTKSYEQRTVLDTDADASVVVRVWLDATLKESRAWDRLRADMDTATSRRLSRAQNLTAESLALCDALIDRVGEHPDEADALHRRGEGVAGEARTEGGGGVDAEAADRPGLGDSLRRRQGVPRSRRGACWTQGASREGDPMTKRRKGTIVKRARGYYAMATIVADDGTRRRPRVGPYTRERKPTLP